MEDKDTIEMIPIDDLSPSVSMMNNEQDNVVIGPITYKDQSFGSFIRSKKTLKDAIIPIQFDDILDNIIQLIVGQRQEASTSANVNKLLRDKKLQDR